MLPSLSSHPSVRRPLNASVRLDATTGVELVDLEWAKYRPTAPEPIPHDLVDVL